MYKKRFKKLVKKLKNDPQTKFIAISCALHLSLALSLMITNIPQEPDQERIEIEYAAAQKPRKIKKTKPKQIVEQAPTQHPDIDPETDLLSASNQKVKEETQAKDTGQFKNVEKTVSATTAMKDISEEFAIKPGSQDSVDKKSQSNDYLKDVKAGMQTLLNTKEYSYYSYYAKIKEALHAQWEPNVRDKVNIIQRDDRDIASVNNHVTRLLVILDKHGELIDVKVLNKSSNSHLDNAALEAFREAAPFPNPPPGLVDSNGTIRIRWDFVLANLN